MSRFKPGDRVYHKNLKLYGTFIDYAWESDDECDVDFENGRWRNRAATCKCKLVNSYRE